MSSAAQQPEPSMEEILASIRRIISEDPNAAPEAEAPKPAPVDDFDAMFAPVAAPPPEPVEEVLELTPDMRADPTPPAPEPVFEPEPVVEMPLPEPEPVFEPVAIAPEPVMMTEPEPVIERVYVEPQPLVEEPEIISPDKAALAAATLASFSATIQSTTRLEGDTIENIVRALLRPMLKEWMDNNLPAMVERQVEAELKRLAGRH